jgi:hypothetical protein
MRGAERFLFPAATPRQLAALRIGLCTILAGRLAFGPYAEVAGQPSELLRPISFMELLPAMPSKSLVVALQALGVLSAVLAALGLHSRVALPLAWACGVFLNGMLTSTGKVVHNDLVLLLCLVPLLAARSADAWSLDARRGTRTHGSCLACVRLAAPHGRDRRCRCVLLRRPREARQLRAGLGDQRQSSLGALCLGGFGPRSLHRRPPLASPSPRRRRCSWSSGFRSCSYSRERPGSLSRAPSPSMPGSGSRWASTTRPRRQPWSLSSRTG